ncbi:MAG TPA: tryptophan--tRNA ligase [Kofleriaceae bacterium]
MAQRVLTGIKPTGTPHVGNLLGAIRPALRLAQDSANDALYFIADYHALITIHDKKQLSHLTLDVAATWLAMGLDPAKVTFYRQTDVPEITELTWILTCFTSKGWMNKAHAYKALLDKNREAGVEDLDSGIGMGVYSYPVLMAADILAFDIDWVPVGKDQVQHIEIARDIAQRLNHTVGAEVLRLPQAKLEENSAIVPGVDGRKMSKSYDNTIALFGTSKELKKTVNRIVTDSLPPEAPKDPETSIIFQIFRAIATPEECEALAGRFRTGIGYGDAKGALFERLEAVLAPTRERYAYLMAHPEEVDAMLLEGAARARATAKKVLDRVRQSLGIRASI